MEYLHGLLSSATKEFEDACIQEHETTQDGFLAWFDMLETWKHLGTKDLRLEDLGALIRTPYQPSEFTSLASYVARFLSWCQQVKAINQQGINVDFMCAFTNQTLCKQQLIQNLQHIESLEKVLEKCHETKLMSLNTAAKEIQTSAARKQHSRDLAKKLLPRQSSDNCKLLFTSADTTITSSIDSDEED